MLKGSLLVLVSRNFQKLVGALVFFLIGGLLDARAVGNYTLLVTVLTYVNTLGSFGIGPAHVYFRGQKQLGMAQMLGNAVAGATLFGVLSLAVFGLLSPLLSFRSYSVLSMFLFSLVFPVVILQSYLDYVWIGENRLTMYSVLYTLRFATLPFFILAGIVLPESVPGKYQGLAAALVANALLTCAFNAYMIGRAYGFRPVLDRTLFTRTARYGLSVQAGSVAQAIGYRFDVFLVNIFLAEAFLGLYSMAFRFAEVLWLLPAAISTALLPRVSTGDERAAQRATAQTSRVVFATSLLGSVGVFVLAGPLLRLLYGEKFLGSVAPLRILLLGIVVFSVQKVLANYFIGQGRAKWFLRATLFSMAVNVGLNLWLIPLPGWGIKGAALASTISYTLSTLILGGLFVRWSGISWMDILIPNRQDAAYVGARLGRLRLRAAGIRRRGATR